MDRQVLAWSLVATVGLLLIGVVSWVPGRGVGYWIALVGLSAYLTLTVVLLGRTDQ